MNNWTRKFACAFKGLRYGASGQSSFTIHFIIAIGVVALATMLRCQRWEWCILLACIGLVLTAEYLNSAIEHLARGLCDEENESVGKALDTASAAVLVAAFFAAWIGILILGVRAIAVLQMWLV
ncbi:MAG TPA: diacylglycerol kinase [Planctomycetaceae bacterium]|nr:diacylglycerol kinase [Planctomycetaceae bacterium]